MTNILVLVTKSLLGSNANVILDDQTSPCRAHLTTSSCCLTGFKQQCVILMRTNKKKKQHNFPSPYCCTAFCCLFDNHSPQLCCNNAAQSTSAPVIFAFWWASPSSMFTQVCLCDRCIFNTQFCICVLANSVPEVWGGVGSGGGDFSQRQGKKVHCERICSEVCVGKKKKSSPDVTGLSSKMRIKLWTLALRLVFILTFSHNPLRVPRPPSVWPNAHWCFVCSHDKLLTSVGPNVRNCGSGLCHSHRCKDNMTVNDWLAFDPSDHVGGT